MFCHYSACGPTGCSIHLASPLSEHLETIMRKTRPPAASSEASCRITDAPPPPLAVFIKASDQVCPSDDEDGDIDDDIDTGIAASVGRGGDRAWPRRRLRRWMRPAERPVAVA
jgi:hypothetical protein